MKPVITIKLEFDRSSETLVEFKAKRDLFKEHINRMQAKGLLPAEPIKWVYTIMAEKKVLSFPPLPHEPTIVHEGGTVLDGVMA
jgi:hypothetical protein